MITENFGADAMAAGTTAVTSAARAAPLYRRRKTDRARTEIKKARATSRPTDGSTGSMAPALGTIWPGVPMAPAGAAEVTAPRMTAAKPQDETQRDMRHLL